MKLTNTGRTCLKVCRSYSSLTHNQFVHCWGFFFFGYKALSVHSLVDVTSLPQSVSNSTSFLSALTTCQVYQAHFAHFFTTHLEDKIKSSLSMLVFAFTTYQNYFIIFFITFSPFSFCL